MRFTAKVKEDQPYQKTMSPSPALPTKLPCTSGKVHLPFPAGEYPVIGCHDILTGSSKDDGVFVRLLYPAKNQNVELSSTHAQWPNWYPDPLPQYKSGLSTIFSSRLAHVVRLVQLAGNDLHLPFIPNADLLQPKTSENSWPVIIFSHGLSSIRTTYSSLCSQFASLGFIVASIEHRDTTAYATMYPTDNGIEWLPHKRMDEFGPYNGSEHFEARQEQIRLRVREFGDVIDILHALNNGSKIENVLEQQGSGLDYAQFRGQINVDNIIAAGHSYGGATCLFALADHPRLKAGLCLDSWMFSLRGFNAKRVKQPILFINMENFHSDESLLKIREFVTAKAEEGEERKVFTIKSSRHTDISDFPMLIYSYPSWITSAVNWVVPLLPKLTPFVVHAAVVSLCTEFVKKHCNIDGVENIEFPNEVKLEEGIILKDEVLQRDVNQEMVEIGRDEIDNES